MLRTTLDRLLLATLVAGLTICPAIAASGAFQASVEAHEGDVTLVSSVTGRFNPAMTAVTTTWTMKVTGPNAGVSDTCESGASSFTASR